MNMRSLFVVLSSLAVACVDTEIRPAPQVVTAEFDPAASPPRVPTPTDLARDPMTGRITVPLPADASVAEKDFARYLEGLDAFPPASHGTATFSAPVDSMSVSADSVIVLDLTARARVTDATARFNASTRRLTVLPATAWPAGHSIAVALRAGPGFLRGANGEAVVAAPAFFFARSPVPLSNCTAPGPGCTSASPLIPVNQAVGLERLRQAFAPLLTAFEGLGVPRAEIALAWSFTISMRPFAAFDPATGRIPFPNDVLRNQSTGLVQLPTSPTDSPAVARLKSELNMLKGFSTTARVIARGDLPSGAQILAGTGLLTNLPNVTATAAGDALILTTADPLPEKSQYLVALTREAQTVAGVPLEPPPLMVFLRSRGTLCENMRATVSALTDSEACQLEVLRLALGAAADMVGIPRESLVLAWGFTTQPTISVLRERVDALPATASMGAPMPIPPGVPRAHIATLMAGTFTGSKGGPVPLLLTLPMGTTAGLVLFQHGLGSSKTAMFAVADTFATGGLATAAMDLPLHGDRMVAGKEFFDFTDLGVTRENLLEAAADLAQLSRTASGTGGLFGQTFPGTPTFAGVSLGAIVGAEFVSLRRPPRVLLSTTGAPIVDIALTSPLFRPRLEQALAAVGIQPGSAAFDQFVDLARWELDAGDPINYVAQLASAPDPGAVLVQIADMDTVIPPALNRRLANLARASVSVYTGSTHAVLINPSDPNVAAAQAQALRFLLGGTP